MTPRLIDAPVLRLAGIRRQYARAKAGAESSRQWVELMALGTLPGQAAQVGYGVHYAAPDAHLVDYMVAVEVGGFEGLARGLERIELPARRYAVFAHDGHVSGMRALRERIAGGGLQSSGVTPAASPAFERFDERFDPVSATGRVEMWFPILS